MGMLLIAVLAGGLAAGALGQPPDELAKTPSWTPPGAEQVRARLLAWLDARGADEAVRASVAGLWSEDLKGATSDDLLDRLARSFALVDAEARQLVELCSRPAEGPAPPAQPWLLAPQTDRWMADNLRLVYGRWLAQQTLFDEAREQLGDLDPGGVVDPATLLFYQAVTSHRLLDQAAGLKAARQLLLGADQSPRRYTALAGLIEQDLEDLTEDDLDHIARRMDDVRRRLHLGRAGVKVREIEDGVIESLDKLIKKAEEQQQQQQQSASNSRNIQSGSPAQDSRIIGGKGPGEVTKKQIGSGSGWGDLPPKEREQALQQIGREFPAHYRDVIEQYFRKLAAEKGERD
jgi:hypothetical protein